MLDDLKLSPTGGGTSVTMRRLFVYSLLIALGFLLLFAVTVFQSPSAVVSRFYAIQSWNDEAYSGWSREASEPSSNRSGPIGENSSSLAEDIVTPSTSSASNPAAASTSNGMSAVPSTVIPTISSSSSITYESLGTSSRRSSSSSIPALIPTTAPPLILVWTTNFGKPWTWIDGYFERCPINRRCTITRDRSLLASASAVLFHIRDLSWTDIPTSPRLPYQYYIFSVNESPHHTGVSFQQPEHRAFFNLTMTYRRDSDGMLPYGTLARGPSANSSSTPTDDELLTVVRGKSKLIAWFVSNCHTPSRREDFVRRLQQSLPVDTFGACGRLQCPRTGGGGSSPGIQDSTPCQQLLTKDYKFYLSLENSLCKDYVTEKFYAILDNAFVVPIVAERKLLLATIEDPSIARVLNDSVIAVDDFADLPSMVSRLKYLDRNHDEYLRYFRWRRTHRVDFEPSEGACRLCEIVRQRVPRRIENMDDWWVGKAQCHSFT